jgi:hypothetical protein
MPFRMNAATPILIGGGFLIVVAIGAVIAAASRGELTPGGLAIALGVIASVIGAGVLYGVKQHNARMPNRVPGFGLCYGGDGGLRTIDEHSRFLSDLVIEWRARIGDPAELLQTLQQLDIEWRPGESFTEGTRTLAGVTRSDSCVVVATRPGRTIGATALAHEIVHAHLWRTTGNPDREHAQFERYAGLIEALRVG